MKVAAGQRLIFGPLFVSLVSASIANASESLIDPPPGGEESFLTPADRLRKFELALDTLGVPSEAAPRYDSLPAAGTVRSESVSLIAKYLDPEGGLRRYLKIQSATIDLFRDFFSLPGARLEHSHRTGAAEDQDSAELLARISRVADQVQSGQARPLEGFRVLLDAGHMSDPTWDRRTGKYVRIGSKTVSEGQLNLWTAMLVGRELESLGAEIRLARSNDGPVTPETLENFDPRAQSAHYYYRSLDNWMPKYLAMSDGELVRRLPHASEVAKLARESGKIDLFLQEDLNARMKVAEEYRPDLLMVFHFDSGSTSRLQNSYNDVEVYIPGAMGKTETGSRADRALMLEHLLETRRWRQSVDIAGHLVRNVAKGLGLPLLRSDRSPSMIKVQDGVYARNLFQTKRATSELCVYFESLHYDHQAEFARLSVKNRTTTFRGRTFSYPSRLEPIASGVREGLLEYFRTFD